MLTVLDEADHVRGRSGPHVILEYGDYECPFSRQAFRSVRRLMKREQGQSVRFAFRHFPLVDFHPHSLPAARAAEAAALQGHFWEMHELLFLRQPLLRDDHLREYARELRLDEARFERDRFGSETLERVRRDLERAERSGEVTGTPTFFIDGVVHRGPYDVDTLIEAICVSPTCSHLDSVRITALPDEVAGCEECLAIGARWLHLRMCQSCGHIGCCDSSPNRHATAHFRSTGHPLMRSAEPGEDWSYCYVDEVAFVLEPR